ncbi:hypothetical protein PIROE2DRAFT_18034 [Piromyces sp. E2]|nr:hypothetical protein PIROE2DRAFT_18034 [Piromyces sp. E2]|eukprot:OUM57086.1 hypothetical protein PIROE2DRAFT_18034 [Piromyces sp. E2]
MVYNNNNNINNNNNNNLPPIIPPTSTYLNSYPTSQAIQVNGNVNRVNNDGNNNVPNGSTENSFNDYRNPNVRPGNNNNYNVGENYPINQFNNNNIPTSTLNNSVPTGDIVTVDSDEIKGVEKTNNNNGEDDTNLHTVVIILAIVIIAIFSLTLVRLKNRSNDKKPISEKRIYDCNKPLPKISPSMLMKQNQLNNQQIPTIQVQPVVDIDMNYNNQYSMNNNNYINPSMIDYDAQQQQQQQYEYDDNRISFLALGDSAIEPRQATLSLKEDVIKKSRDNVPIPLIHINNVDGPNSNDETYGNNHDIDEDDINLKAVEPLPGTIIPSKKSPDTSFSNSRFLQESHGLFKKVTKGVKNVGNRLKPNSIISTISNSSKTSNDLNNNSNGRYSLLSSPKEKPSSIDENDK